MTLNKSHHLVYLDGLRGLAALYVVIHHAYMEVRQTADFPSWLLFVTNWLFYGQVAVDIFIVLSGYCLMMPVVLSDGRLRGGLLQYFLRRSRRILPPFYIALLLLLLYISYVPNLNVAHGLFWDLALPAFKPDILISHLFLIHNLDNDWIYKIDPPMWSVATEWQIYILFPLLLLPIWRRFGNIATIVVAFSLGLAPHFLLHSYDSACPWFLGLFAMGMVAAVINNSELVYFKQILKWSRILGIATATILILIAYNKEPWLWKNMYVMDILAGFAVACLLIYCTIYSRNYSSTAHPVILKLMSSRYPVLLGTFSYSLYLTHFPVLSLIHQSIAPLRLPAIASLILTIGIGTIFSLAVAFIFYLSFERRFMNSPLSR